MHQAESGSGYDALALETSERARARSLVHLLEERGIDITRGLPAELKERERAIHLRLSRAQRALLAAQEERAPRDALAAIETAVVEAEREREQLEREIRGRYREYADLHYPSPPTLSQIQALLDRDTALLEYVLAPTGSTLFVVTQEELRTYRLPPAAEIEDLVRDLRATIEQPGRRSARQYTGAARRLYDVLIAPAAALVGDKRTLLVVPDLALNHLPFEALLTADPDGGSFAFERLPYLVNRWTVSYIPSAGALASLRRRARAPEPHGGRLVIIGDPASGPEDGRAGNATTGPSPRLFPALAAARDEIAAISRRYPGGAVTVYARSDAREEHIKHSALVSDAQRLHFVTHGLVDDRRPERSALVLAVDPSSTEDGLLQVHEIFNLNLSSEIVVLSACQTALGKDVPGEGVMGLTRAFLYAGASSVAASLWRVADSSTADLMAAFHERMATKGRKADALREAKLALIAGGRWMHPYYWAPFVLMGEPR